MSLADIYLQMSVDNQKLYRDLMNEGKHWEALKMLHDQHCDCGSVLGPPTDLEGVAI
jgi:hypothetical protein